MTVEEFFYWFKGFAAAANAYNITPKQWETIVEKLEQVEEVRSNAYTLMTHPIYTQTYTYGTVSSSNDNNKIILND